MHLVPLRARATCQLCESRLPPRTEAWWDEETKQALCLSCQRVLEAEMAAEQEREAAPPPANVAEPDLLPPLSPLPPVDVVAVVDVVEPPALVVPPVVVEEPPVVGSATEPAPLPADPGPPPVEGPAATPETRPVSSAPPLPPLPPRDAAASTSASIAPPAPPAPPMPARAPAGPGSAGLPARMPPKPPLPPRATGPVGADKARPPQPPQPPSTTRPQVDTSPAPPRVPEAAEPADLREGAPDGDAPDGTAPLPHAASTNVPSELVNRKSRGPAARLVRRRAVGRGQATPPRTSQSTPEPPPAPPAPEPTAEAVPPPDPLAGLVPPLPPREPARRPPPPPADLAPPVATARVAPPPPPPPPLPAAVREIVHPAPDPADAPAAAAPGTDRSSDGHDEVWTPSPGPPAAEAPPTPVDRSTDPEPVVSTDERSTASTADEIDEQAVAEEGSEPTGAAFLHHDLDPGSSGRVGEGGELLAPAPAAVPVPHGRRAVDLMGPPRPAPGVRTPEVPAELLDRGDAGEGRVGQALEDARTTGLEVVHGVLTEPGLAPIDHLVIAVNGVWVVDAVDELTGKLERRDEGDWFTADPRLHIGGEDHTPLIAAVRDKVDAMARLLARTDFTDIPVRGVVCFGSVQPGWITEPFVLDGVAVTWRRKLVEPLLDPILIDQPSRNALLQQIVADQTARRSGAGAGADARQVV